MLMGGGLNSTLDFLKFDWAQLTGGNFGIQGGPVPLDPLEILVPDLHVSAPDNGGEKRDAGQREGRGRGRNCLHIVHTNLRLSTISFSKATLKTLIPAVEEMDEPRGFPNENHSELE